MINANSDAMQHRACSAVGSLLDAKLQSRVRMTQGMSSCDGLINHERIYSDRTRGNSTPFVSSKYRIVSHVSSLYF